MHSRDALLDIHDRCHKSLSRLVEHCRGLTQEQLDQRHDGFGYGCVRVQIQHLIGAERYWVSVVQGALDASENPEEAESVDALESFRAATAWATRHYLAGASEVELNEARAMEVYGGATPSLTPAHVVLRTQTHMFHHMGQVSAMCRLLGHPVPAGLDFPLLA